MRVQRKWNQGRWPAGGGPAGPGQGELGGGRWEGVSWPAHWVHGRAAHGDLTEAGQTAPGAPREDGRHQKTRTPWVSATTRGNWSPAPCRQEQSTVQLPCEPAQWFLEERSEHCQRPRGPASGHILGARTVEHLRGNHTHVCTVHCPQQPWGEAAQRPSRDVGQTHVAHPHGRRQKDSSAIRGRKP